MKTVNRRELNQRSGQILDEVIATGEPVEVVSRDGESVVISKRVGSLYDEWVRLGVVVPAKGRMSDAPRATSPRSAEELLDAIDSDH